MDQEKLIDKITQEVMNKLSGIGYSESGFSVESEKAKNVRLPSVSMKTMLSVLPRRI